MTKKAVAIRHLMFEDLGIIGPLLADRGYHVRYLDAGIDTIDTDTLADADLVVVLGGPIGANDSDRYPFLTAELEAITARVQARRPTLGICLGAQLIARALGASVEATGRTEIGYAPLTLTAQAQDSPLRHLQDIPVLHWHGDQFAIPAGAVKLAATPDFPNQAFAAGPNILALQFHLETHHRDIERWLIGHAEALAAADIHPEPLRRSAANLGPALIDAAVQVFADWLDALTEIDRWHTLPVRESARVRIRGRR